MDVLADANDILQELGVHFEASASEATAARARRLRDHRPQPASCQYRQHQWTSREVATLRPPTAERMGFGRQPDTLVDCFPHLTPSK
ncbi:hypothetical protein MyNCGM683_10940 [Achromobacter xylosoxidans]